MHGQNHIKYGYYTLYEYLGIRGVCESM